MKRIIFTHGDKGGVGKSEAARRTAAVLLSQSKDLTLVDADVKNQGLCRAFSDHHDRCHVIDMKNPRGIREFFNIANEAPGDVLVDLRGNASEDVTLNFVDDGTDENAFPIRKLLEKMGAEMVVLFVIDQNLEPLAALRDEYKAFPDMTWVVVKNHLHQEPFTWLDESNIKKELDQKKIPFIDLDRVDPFTIRTLFKHKENLLTGQATEHLSFIEHTRVEGAFNRWKKQLEKAGLIRG